MKLSILDSSLVKVGESVVMKCKITGRLRPFAIYSWEKDGSDLMPTSRRDIKTRLRGERLKIRNVRPIDAGRYRCRAKVSDKILYSKSVVIRVKGK